MNVLNLTDGFGRIYPVEVQAGELAASTIHELEATWLRALDVAQRIQSPDYPTPANAAEMPGHGPVTLLRRLYREEQAQQWPQARPFGRHLSQLIELEFVRWPVGGVGTLTEAGRILARNLEGTA